MLYLDFGALELLGARGGAPLPLPPWGGPALNVLKIKVKLLVTIKIEAMIKGEHKGKQLKKKHLELIIMMMVDQFNLNHKCHTQEFIKAFNGIISLTIYLGVFEQG